MVARCCALMAAWAPVIAADAPQPLIRRLDPQTRAKVLAALAALLILGFMMVVLIWLGARYTRRYINDDPRRREKTTPHDADDWATKPLMEHSESNHPDDTSET